MAWSIVLFVLIILLGIAALQMLGILFFFKMAIGKYGRFMCWLMHHLSGNLTDDCEKENQYLKQCASWLREMEPEPLFHGWRGSWDGDLAVLARKLYEKDSSILLVDQRAHGFSEGKYIFICGRYLFFWMVLKLCRERKMEMENNSKDGSRTEENRSSIQAGQLLIVTESGSDIPEDMRKEYGISVVPMHVVMDGQTYDDGHFPVTQIFDYYQRTKKVPSTSATNPEEYRTLFEELHKKYPGEFILHLCYSAVTTATWQNAMIASEDLDYVYHVDTKNVSGGLAMVVKKTADYIREHPEAELEKLLERVRDWSERARFAFLPRNLDYLKSGGRVTNAAYLGATLLNLKPLIELKDGYVTATKKYRGPMEKVCRKALEELLDKYHMEKDEIFLLHSGNFEKELCRPLERFAREKGYHNITWLQTGGVITTHGGPGCFGVIGMEGL